jgi:hypothetical protein
MRVVLSKLYLLCNHVVTVAAIVRYRPDQFTLHHMLDVSSILLPALMQHVQ